MYRPDPNIDLDDPFMGMPDPSQTEIFADLDRAYEAELIKQRLAEELERKQ